MDMFYVFLLQSGESITIWCLHMAYETKTVLCYSTTLWSINHNLMVYYGICPGKCVWAMNMIPYNFVTWVLAVPVIPFCSVDNIVCIFFLYCFYWQDHWGAQEMLLHMHGYGPQGSYICWTPVFLLVLSPSVSYSVTDSSIYMYCSFVSKWLDLTLPFVTLASKYLNVNQMQLANIILILVGCTWLLASAFGRIYCW